MKELVMSHSRPRPPDANLRQLSNQAKDSIHKELRHRGQPLVAYPGAELWKAVGGSDGVAALIKDLYRRIEQDELLRGAFSHFNCPLPRSDRISGGILPICHPIGGCGLHREFGKGLPVEKFVARPALQEIFLIPRPSSSPVK